MSCIGLKCIAVGREYEFYLLLFNKGAGLSDILNETGKTGVKRSC